MCCEAAGSCEHIGMNEGEHLYELLNHTLLLWKLAQVGLYGVRHAAHVFFITFLKKAAFNARSGRQATWKRQPRAM